MRRIIGIISIVILMNSVSAAPQLVIEDGDRFKFKVMLDDEVKINGTDYTDPVSKSDEVRIEVIDISSDITTVSVKETYIDGTSNQVDSLVDSWRLNGMYFFVMDYVDMLSLMPTEMDFSGINPGMENLNHGDDYTYGYFANSDPGEYEGLYDSGNIGVTIINDAENGVFTYDFTNSSSNDGVLDDGTRWSISLDLNISTIVEYSRSIVSASLVEYTITEKMGDAEKNTHFLMLFEEISDSIGNLDRDTSLFIISVFLVFVIAVIIRRKLE